MFKESMLFRRFFSFNLKQMKVVFYFSIKKPRNKLTKNIV